MTVQGMEYCMLYCLGGFCMTLDIVITIHQYLRFHDGYHPFCLTHCSITSQHFRIGFNSVLRRRMLINGIHFTPFGKTCSLLPVTTQAVGEPVQSESDQVAR